MSKLPYTAVLHAGPPHEVGRTAVAPRVGACVVEAVTRRVAVLMEHVVLDRAVGEPPPLQTVRVVHLA